jgi:nucleotide-binding universal stress UspA family protein
MPRTGPVVVAYDATPASARAAGGRRTRGRSPALVLVIWKAGLAFELIALPASSIGLPPAPLDIRAALEAEATAYDGARRAAEQGRLARPRARARRGAARGRRRAGGADPRHDRERRARAVVVGAHAHGPSLGSVSRGVIRAAPCAVVVVREDLRKG